MNIDVSRGIEELKRQFSGLPFAISEDGQGGAHVVIEGVTLSARFNPQKTWLGFHITAQYPYADIYPVFIDGGVTRADGVAFSAPVTNGHLFQGRNAIQVSRRNGAAGTTAQKATSKILKVLDFLEKLP